MILEQNKKIYEQTASQLVGWRDIDKSELLIRAGNAEGVDRDKYFAAVILKYWNKLEKYYYKCKLVATPEDVHTWLINAILYALDHKAWEDPESNIHNDPNGPDKVVNRAMESIRLTFYQQLNRHKRKVNSATLSLDTLIEDYDDVFNPASPETIESSMWNYIVVDYFNKKDYFVAFMIDIILYDDVVKDKLDEKRLNLYLRNIDDKYCVEFAHRYNYNVNDVIKASSYVTKLSNTIIRKKIEYTLLKLGKEIREDL